MNTQERQRLEQGADWYVTGQLDFDKRLIGFRYQTVRHHLRGPAGLELGPADGQMTQFLVNHFETLVIVDGSAKLLSLIPDDRRVTKIAALFEEFAPMAQFDTIVMEHILEHVENPVDLLWRAKTWLAPGGRMLLGVPNAHSIHRLAAVKMGILKAPTDLNDRDHALGHRRVYTPTAFRNDVQAANLTILESGGIFFKPLSNKQIQDHWDERMLQGFYELGKQFPDNAAELYLIVSAG
ncbi:MAG TPA: class I SAM-dependent methyltransferase [Humisphaera sp.]|nr:class I SAM-dependent methyltransferase [Humisphaera sp.]